MYVPKCLYEFTSCMQDRNAGNRLLNKLVEIADNANGNSPFVTKIAYFVDEIKVIRLIFTDLYGEESFNELSNDMHNFIFERHSYNAYGLELSQPLNQSELRMLQKYNDYCLKKIAKDKAKNNVTVRYKIGDVVALNSKICDGSKKNFKTYVVKKIIWSVQMNPVNIIIVKQITGDITNMSLSKSDCKRYHIKYEENLQVYSMMMNFIKINRNK